VIQLLDDDQRRRLRDCLAKDELNLRFDKFERLTHDIEASIALFFSVETADSFRKAHDILAELWGMAHDTDPQVGVLRGRIQRLSKQPLEYVERRWANVRLRLFPEVPRKQGFQDWALKADEEELLTALRVITAEGAKATVGRSRGDGKRSSTRVAPIIMGEARGAGSQTHRGGRPRADERKTLVMHLALDWLQGTDNMPAPGRDGYGGFSDLVHAVFEWLNLPEGAAAYALRHYWAEVAAGQTKLTADRL
jgi:hypothetical protein